MNKYQEQWKTIKDYPNYEVSNYGYVRANTKKSKGKILSFGKTNDGYLQVCLYKNGKKKSYRVNRLVAKHFIPNPNNYLEVNHLDKNINNNNADNLEWCDRTRNVRYSKARKVGAYKNGKLVKIYGAIYDTQNDGYSYGNVRNVCEGTRKSAYGYEWNYI